ncbi:MAG: substrate-binding domain-containing protein [Rhodospirillales bacterium]
MHTLAARALLCLGLCWAAAPAAGLAETLVLGGAGGALGTMHMMADAYSARHRGVEIKILASLGSGGGIKAVLSDALDLGLASRSLKSKERQAGAREIPYGQSAVVFVTPARTKIVDVTTDQILDIFSRTIRHWHDGTPIRPILRPLSDSNTRILARQVSGFDRVYRNILMAAGIPILYTEQKNAHMIETTPGAIGFTSLAQALSEKHPLNVLSYNGTTAAPKTIADRSYPLSKTFRFIVRNKPEPPVVQFFDFVFSAEGSAILRQTGHAPLQRSAGN